MQCTWKGCPRTANKPQLDKHKKEWANLCDDHNEALENSVKDGNAKGMLRAWVLASGGAEKLANRMFK